MSELEGVSPVAGTGSRVSPRLVALNAALLGVLVLVTVMGSRPTTAQTSTPGPMAARGRGDYTMVSGKYSGATSSAVYIVDVANQEVVVLGWDRTNSRLNPIGFRSLVDDAHYLTKPR
jgi:hypothetical protein